MLRWLIIVLPLNFAQAQLFDFSDMENTGSIEGLYRSCQNTKNLWDRVDTIKSNPSVIGFEQGRTALGDLCMTVNQMMTYHRRLKDLDAKYRGGDQRKDGFERKLLLAASIYSSQTSEMSASTVKTPAEIIKGRKRGKFSAFYKRITGVSLNDAMIDPQSESSANDARNMAERLASLSGQRAALTAKLQCKTGQNEDLKRRYENELQPLQIKFETASDQLDYYYDELKSLSHAFARERKTPDYKKELFNVHNNSYVITPVDIEKTVTGYNRRKQGDEYILEPTEKKLVIQVFDLKVHPELIRDFENKWKPIWKESAKTKFDIVLSSLERANSCEKYDINAQEMLRKPAEAKEQWFRMRSECINKRNITPKTASIHFENMIRQYLTALDETKKNEALMLSKESELLGQPLYATKETMTTLINKEDIGCKTEHTSSDMVNLKMQMLANENELRQLALESTLRRRAIKEAAIERKDLEFKNNETEKELTDKQAYENSIKAGMMPKTGEF